MNDLLYTELALTVLAGTGFLFGAVKYVRPHKPLYASMIVLGVGCIMSGHAYTFMRILTGLPVGGIFHPGTLGTAGAFAFFFSSNYGQIDSLADDGSRKFLKYRAAAFLSVFVTAAVYVFILLSPAPAAEKVTDGIVAVTVAGAAYFHMKHIMIPDVDYGVVRCLRGFNVLALIYAFLCMAEMAAAACGRNDILFAVTMVQGPAAVLMIPVMDRGVRRWST